MFSQECFYKKLQKQVDQKIFPQRTEYVTFATATMMKMKNIFINCQPKIRFTPEQVVPIRISRIESEIIDFPFKTESQKFNTKHLLTENRNTLREKAKFVKEPSFALTLFFFIRINFIIIMSLKIGEI